MKNELTILNFIIIPVLLVGLALLYLSSDQNIFSNNKEEFECIEKTNRFFEKIHREVNPKLDYSFAKNDSVLEVLLGSNYSHITKRTITVMLL